MPDRNWRILESPIRTSTSSPRTNCGWARHFWSGSESVLRCHRQSFFTRGSDHYAIPTPETISPIHYRELLPKQRRQRELPRFSSKVREASLTWSGYSDELHTIQTHRRSIFRI